MAYKTKEIELDTGEYMAAVECLYHEDDPGHDDEWLADMTTLELFDYDGEPLGRQAGVQEERFLRSRFYDLANGRVVL